MKYRVNYVVEFVKGKALMGAIVILVGGLLELLFGVQSMLNPEVWAPLERVLPSALALIFGIIVVLAGLLVLTGNNSGNMITIIMGLLLVLVWSFLAEPPVALPYAYYIKAFVGPLVYLMGGLFGLSIKED
jgi:hypothetical protein